MKHHVTKNMNDAYATLMLNSLPIYCCLFNKRLEMIDCSCATVKFFQCIEKHELCERIFEMFPERQPDGKFSSDAILFELNKAFGNGHNKIEWLFLLPDGALVPTEIVMATFSCGSEEVLAIYIRDLREEKMLRAARDDARDFTRLLLDATPLCCSFWNEQGKNIACNHEAVRLFGLTSKEDFLNHFFDLSPKKQPGGEPSEQKALRCVKKAFEDGRHRFEWLHQKLNGEPVPTEVTLVRIERDKQFVVVGYARDLRKEKMLLEAKMKATQKSQTDVLTRLYHKRTTKLLIENVLNIQDTKSRHAFVCVDLDNFKSVNDDFGHLFGDEILIEISKKLKRIFRASDILGRFGGDEFVLLIKDIPSLDFARAKVESLCAQIKKNYRVGDVEHTVSASIGVSIYPDDGTTYQDLYKNADAASYCAKRAGKNRCMFWADCEQSPNS